MGCHLKRLFRYGVLSLLILLANGYEFSYAGVVDNLNEYEHVVNKVLPEGWSITETSADVLPDGHYWGMEYKGHKGVGLVLIGKNDVPLDWKDQNDTWHKSPAAKESIDLWIMPHDYKLSWKRFFIFHRPEAAELIFSTPEIKVYGSAGHKIIDQKTFNGLISKAKSTKWPESPSNDGKLSWDNWETAIQGAFDK